MKNAPRRQLVFAVALLGLVAAIAPPAEAEPFLSVAIYDHSGKPEATGPTNLERLLTPDAGFQANRVSAEEIRGGVLATADVVIFPGGSGSAQSKRLEAVGREAVKQFVRDGGGYVGICAGSYLASAEYDWSLHLIRTRVLDRKHWARGKGVVTLSLSEEGRAILGADTASAEVMYAQGPLLAPAVEPGLSPYVALALYESEIAKKGAPEGVMVGTTAIAAGDFGSGRVLCFSPHPEKDHGPHGFIPAGVRWAAGEGRQ